MITIKIVVPHSASYQLTPEQLINKFIIPDSRVKYLQAQKKEGLCSVNVKNIIDWEDEVTHILVEATYKDKESEMIAWLTL